MKRLVLFVVVVSVIIGLQIPIASQEKKPASAGLVVDKEKQTVTIDVVIAERKLPHLKGEIYPLEVIATWAHPKGKKAHEAIVTLDDSIKPSAVHKALESLGLKAGTPVMGPGEPKGPALNVYLVIPDPTGLPRKVTLDKAMVDKRSGKPFPKNVEWRFTGSKMVQPDPNKDEKVYGADHSGTLMSIFPVTAETVLQTNLSIDFEKFMKLEVNTKVLPKIGTPVKLVIEVKKK